MNIDQVLKEQEESFASPNGFKPGDIPRYTVRNAAYALQPQPPIEYLIDKLVTSCSVNVFFGEPGSKKTYILVAFS